MPSINGNMQRDRTPGVHPRRYLIENWVRKQLKPSAVRNCIHGRVLWYTHHTGINYLWSDAHCICQDTIEGADCTGHTYCVETRETRCLASHGSIPGELRLSSVELSKQATQLCLALRGMERIDDVLRMAERYTLLVPASNSMTPRVMAYFEARGLSKP
ncbi:hypothetical protein GCG54_00015330 [Colletotrichum gloeosporioides]|uniref:Uncharacterized protein n=1 Tax=Colletotrichum gloeosporioides TaxID=474922 RepID=A0A8H4FEU3_COLGL|nr:uncharacterized protein GCG54_00015330 [Colletotrichum gloeosporioides]KAF3799146.1 hypothetical protein GCG54_00015330 [Colletotrichum gloeosporioides]